VTLNNDGLTDAYEIGGDSDNPINTDGDDQPDYLDTNDSDGDGIDDMNDRDADGDGMADLFGDGALQASLPDEDGDGVVDLERINEPIAAAAYRTGLSGGGCSIDQTGQTTHRQQPEPQVVKPIAKTKPVAPKAKAAPVVKPPKPAPKRNRPDTDIDRDGVINSIDQCPETKPGIAVDAKGCAVFNGTIEGLNFAPDSAELSNEAKAILIIDRFSAFTLPPHPATINGEYFTVYVVRGA